ncbi:helix-turn-helix transcriptional regulator [Glycomyces sp. NRRL B-16210]|uniref:ArsR/SmtB family transcription factor n=1 Tax=Glycomyces sp. NRRL B-16210 TaxID=1463821 RepID=UPI000B2A2622|nr:metalloregulator ArsR/SmtB family transcription factor [Glycomyces sp. NRRL B-16210]
MTGENAGVPPAEAAFDALGDPVRRRIMELLGEGERPAGAVAEALGALPAPGGRRGGISQPAVSQHLKVLREAGLVTVRAEGTRRIYGVDERGLAAVQDWLARFADGFAGPLDALETELARGKRERRLAAKQAAERPQSAARRRHGAALGAFPMGKFPARSFAGLAKAALISDESDFFVPRGLDNRTSCRHDERHTFRNL